MRFEEASTPQTKVAPCPRDVVFRIADVGREREHLHKITKR
jgi:hypothetical protein